MLIFNEKCQTYTYNLDIPTTKVLRHLLHVSYFFPFLSFFTKDFKTNFQHDVIYLYRVYYTSLKYMNIFLYNHSVIITTHKPNNLEKTFESTWRRQSPPHELMKESLGNGNISCKSPKEWENA